MKRAVSVIIPVYNVERYIDECISSILMQTYPDIEIIVVYDESPDRTREHLRNYERRIILIEQGKTNPSVARNVALKIARSPYVAFCDADDYWAPTKVEEQVAFLERHPKIGVCYTNIIDVDDSGRVIGRHVSHSPTLPFIAISSILVRRKLFDEIGYFDEQIEWIGDFDIYLRLSKVTEFANLNSFLTYRRQRRGQMARNKLKMAQGYTQVFRKHGMRVRFMKSMFAVFLYKFLLKKTLPPALRRTFGCENEFHLIKK